MSLAKAKILAVFLEDTQAPRWGYQLLKATGVRSGSLYPILEQLVVAGWLRSEWETVPAGERNRPPRRTFFLTAEGLRSGEQMLREFAEEALAAGAFLLPRGSGA